MAQRQGDESDQLKVLQQIVCAHLQDRDSSGRAAEKRLWENLLLRESIMKKNHGNNEQRQGGPLESVC